MIIQVISLPLVQVIFDKQQSFKVFAATEDSDYGSDQNLVLSYTYQFN